MDKKTSVVFYEDYAKDVFTTLNSSEINLLYVLLDVATLQFSKTKSMDFEISIDALPQNCESTLKKLRSMIMVINTHDTQSVCDRSDVNLIRKIKINDGIMYFSLEEEILLPYMQKRSDFDQMFVKIDWALKSKYSKFLYNILSSHRNSEYTVHYELLLVLLNLSNPKYLASRAYGVFNKQVLKKCVDEINTWSDLNIVYYPVKSKCEKQVVEKVTFEIFTQQPKNIAPELSEQEQMNIKISQLIEEKASKIYEKSKQSYNILDKSAYVNGIIKKFNRDDIESEIRLIDWLEYTKKEFKPNTNQPACLCIDPNGKSQMITITNDFGLYDILSKKYVVTKPSNALKKINTWIQKGDIHIEFKPLGRIYDEHLISYVNI
jgi:plasmid replication initiation protein